MGNFFRGAPVKEFTQINHKLLGAGLIVFVSCFLKIILLASELRSARRRKQATMLDGR